MEDGLLSIPSSDPSELLRLRDGIYAADLLVCAAGRLHFFDWLASHPTYADVASLPAPNVAAGRTSYAVCSACHGAAGEGNQMLNAPKLTGLQDWYLERQILNFKHGLRGADASDTFGMQMAPMAATLADGDAIRNTVAYIASLPETAPTPTISGDVERGADIFTTCSSCHGKDGQGIWSQNAPSLKGSNDWYIARQLENYRQGIRGSHPQDLYGKQMSLITIMLRDEQAIADVVAYINTF